MTRLRSFIAVLLGCVACSREPTASAADGSMPVYLADPKLQFRVFAEGLGAARQMAVASNGDLFVNNGKVTVLWDADHDGVSRAHEQAVFARASGLNHGLAFDREQRFLYASSDTTVYRFAYKKGAHAASSAAEVVVRDIPSGGHSTRTLVFDSQQRLYVSVGSSGNVDTGERELALRSQIRRFTIPDKLPSGGMPYTSGSVIASGMRNEVGLYVDSGDHLWGVENGRDNVHDNELGGDIHNDNPGEKINAIDPARASFFGYPFCFPEFRAPNGHGPGTLWADESLPNDLRKTDAFCQDPSQVQPPAFVMPAHWAPLGVLRYTGSLLPYRGDLIITAHGSWNRSPPSGRLLARARIEHDAVVAVEPLVAQPGASGGSYVEGTWDVRPVDVQQAADGSVFCSDDMGGRIFRLSYAR